ncbi:hypothetical protein PTT_20151, partial [Pyrenophora teres f. teres 0-1]
MAKRQGYTLCMILLRPLEEPGCPRIRRAAADEDFDKFMNGIPETTLEEILTPQLFQEYSSCIPVFDKAAAGKLPEHSEFDHNIELKPDAKIPNHRPRPFSGQQLEAIRLYVEDMENKGFIERCNSPARNSLLIVAKPGGGLRV